MILGTHAMCTWFWHKNQVWQTNTIVESQDVTFDETTPCPHDVFECAGDKEMEESIFVDEEL
jgi:hypothetical protein